MDKTLEEFRLRIAHAQIDSEQIEQDLWDARQRIAGLETDVAELREACRLIAAYGAEWSGNQGGGISLQRKRWKRLAGIASAALGQKGVGDG